MTTAEQSHAAHDDAAGLMPEPGDAANLSTSSQSADDLIARLADEQIDGLLDDASPDAEDAAAFDNALDAASHNPEAIATLDAAAAALTRELDSLNIETPPPEIAPVEEAAAPVETTIADESPAAEPVIEAPAFEEVAEHATEPAEAVITEVAAPSFNPPAHAEVETLAVVASTEVAHEPATHVATEEHSDADAVARELAADVALLSTPLPAVVEHEAAEHASPTPKWWQKAIAFVLRIPMMILEAINLPVKPLSDRGREIIGGIGIVTLVNAAGLLIYLAAFAHRH